ncbi:LacI family DNA-binding transcriptional regulator [Winogradskyella sp. SYSU M77433]|uniref:LacI family DNA-binding transcriptional regulator n=1 Tax=Winogradskyella sp. SYSU M77433 TaxID=3042722 RepID=UPI0024807C42|nr:LacI family DNA-binding transcriptional regulator [Winogradskyella sp. SYSU M77433]MDH7913436.1 LacI family DNA-binding transcriptional regulator [Winogradskyella sp. SYSU M77433]
MKSSTLTIKEISSMSGFSVSTVSKALNDKQDISIETRNAIKGIAKKFNYVPNNYAVALRIKKSQSIAIVLPEVTQKSYNQALCYLQQSAEGFGYRVLLYQTFNSPTKEEDYINSLNDGSIDGVIIVSTENKSKVSYNNSSIPLELLQLNLNHSPEEIKQLSHSSLMSLLNIE